MKKLSLVLALALLLMLNLPVLAQDDDEERDILEVVLFAGAAIPSGGLSDWSGSDGPLIGAKMGLSYGGEIGVFATASLVIGVNFTYSQHTLDTDEGTGDMRHRFFNPALYFKYYFFGESNLAPYFKVHAGIDNPKFTTEVTVTDNGTTSTRFRELSYDPVFAFGAGGGLFYYTSDYSGLFLEANYHHGASSETEGTYQDLTYGFGETTGMVDIHAGVKIFFGTD